MSGPSPVLKRVVRRETHSPRTVMTVVVLVLLVAVAIWTGIEIVLHLLRTGPLLVTPDAALTWLTRLPGEPGAAITGGVIAAAAGLVLLWAGVSPGRRARHQLGTSSVAVVADNEVIASAVAERLRRELDLPRDRVTVGIGHRSADVTVHAEPGQDVDGARVRALAEAELASYDLTPRLRLRARVRRPAGRAL